MTNQNPEITPKAIRQLLKQWDTADQLGRHPLANLLLVHQRRSQAGHVDSTVGQGLALKAILTDAIETLRPDDGDPRPLERDWRPYLIITERYCLGRIPDWIMSQLHIAPRTFYKEMKQGVERVAAQIRHAERTLRFSGEITADDLKPDKVEPPTPTFLFNGPLLPSHPIIGREDILTRLTHWLHEEPPRTIAIHGLPGVGKTTVATLLAHQSEIRTHFPDGILWLGVGRDPDLQTLLSTLAHQLNLDPGNKDPDHLIPLIREAIHEARTLIIIDDVWKTTTALSLSLGGRNAKHLITTRHSSIALDLAGQYTLSLEELSPAVSQNLLTQLAPQAAADQLPIDEIQTLVGGLPLALVVIGKQLHKASYRGQTARLQHLLTRLQEREERLQLELVRPSVTMPSQHTAVSLSTIIALSIEALPPEAQQALTELSLLPPKPNSFTHTAALAITQTDPQTLDTLVDAGLLEPTNVSINDSDRYTIHQLIHDYVTVNHPNAQNQLPLATYFTTYIEEIKNDFLAIEQEQTNLQAALTLAADHPAVDLLARALLVYIPYLIDRNRITEAQRWVQDSFKLAKQADNSAAIARLHICHGRLARRNNQIDEALEHFTKSHIIADRIDLQELSLIGKVAAAATYIRHGEPAAALELADDLRHLISRSPDPRWRASAHRSISGVYYFSGDYSAASYHVKQARDLYEQLQETAPLARIYQNLGAISVARGQYSIAQTYYDIALESYRLTGNKAGVSHILNNLGVLALNIGQWQQATTYHTRALAIRHELDDQFSQGQSLLNLGVVSLSQKDTAQAAVHLKNCRALTEQSNLYARQTKLLVNLAWLSRLENNNTQAFADASSALNLAQEIDNQQSVGDSYFQLALACIGLNRPAQAHHHFAAAVQIWHNQEQPQLLAETHAHWAKLHLQEGHLEKAERCLEDVLPYIGRSTAGFEDPAEILLICDQILTALVKTEQAAEIRTQAQLFIKQQSQQITDPAVRENYINSYQPYLNVENS